MPAVPVSQHSTAEKVVQWWAAKKQTHRPHLGASLIGHECDRYLWLTFRWAKLAEFEGRLLRLFDRGNREEPRIHEELRGIGVELHTMDGDKQIACRDPSGHFGGSVDGVGRGFPEAPKSWAVLECKTHSASSFQAMQKKGVKESKPRHHAQMQVYMGLMDLDRALYYAVNKDTDEVYTEWVHFDAAEFQKLQERATRIIEATEPPAKLSDDPAFWICKTCDMYALCHQQKVAAANCRTCVAASPVENGRWHCQTYNSIRTDEEQGEGCPSHLFIPALVPFGEAVDGGNSYVEYRHRDTGKTFRNGPDGYSSKELAASCAETVTEPVVEAMRKTFSAKVVESTPTPGRRRGKAVDLSKFPKANEPFVDDKEIPF